MANYTSQDTRRVRTQLQKVKTNVKLYSTRSFGGTHHAHADREVCTSMLIERVQPPCRSSISPDFMAIDAHRGWRASQSPLELWPFVLDLRF